MGALKGGPFRIFQHPLLQNIKKMKGDPLVDKKFLKSRTMPKKLEAGGPFSLAGFCVPRIKKEKPFWFSSLGQQVQFDTLKFRRTF